MGFVTPTPIQEKAIPAVRSGADILGIAQTGTGKTAAYLIPLLMKLVKADGMDPRVIILVPTRELSIQVGEDLKELLLYSNIRYASIYGGIGWTIHAEMVKAGIDILIATPGRLMELYHVGALSFRKVKTLVIDEADRMLDMGFMPQLHNLFEVIPSKRQNLLFSATFSARIEEMSHEFLALPQRIEITPSATPAELVEQRVYRVPNYVTKRNLILYFLEDADLFSRVIVFCRTKKSADDLFGFLKKRIVGGIRILHSNKAQSSRINTINIFKEGEIRVLISTDISARGIDVSMVSHVINLEVPTSYEDYVHRIGRTARANNHGVAISLIDPSEEWHMKNIETIIRMQIPIVDIPSGVEVVPTDFEENQYQLREIDRQRKIDDPSFKGAFHPKQRKIMDPTNMDKHRSVVYNDAKSKSRRNRNR